MFKPADHDRRLPAVLQAHTKENIIFQLTLAGAFIGGMFVKDYLAERRLAKEFAQDENPTKN